jgi:hypothetical protein
VTKEFGHKTLTVAASNSEWPGVMSCFGIWFEGRLSVH